MAVDLNGIELTQWEDNPNVNRQIAERIESAIWQSSPFEPLIGKGQKTDSNNLQKTINIY